MTVIIIVIARNEVTKQSPPLEIAAPFGLAMTVIVVEQENVTSFGTP